MDLGKYLTQFCSQRIDGQLLSECDEELLLHKLNVTNVVHRAKLMKIVTGKQSAMDILRHSGQQ